MGTNFFSYYYYRSGGACTAAAFLRAFAGDSNWAHLDIAGVMENKDEVPYLGKGMSGKEEGLTEGLIDRLMD